MLADTAFEDVNQEFTIRRETLGGEQSGSHWQQYRSAPNTYQLSDFLEMEGRPKVSLVQPIAIFLVGVIFSACLLISGAPELVNSQSKIHLAQWNISLSAAIFSGLSLVLTIALSTLVYSLQHKAAIVWDKSERWKYVAPGWGAFHFTFGAVTPDNSAM